MPAPLLEIRNLRLDRGSTRILRGINWRVERGQRWVILGPNGSGKTTLLAALYGYAMPTAGEIALLGQIYGASHWPELRKKIGLVSSVLSQQMAPDEPAIETVISGRHAQIDLWQRPTLGERADAISILRRIECVTLAHRPWRVLSQGERQRVLIGRALMVRPRLLILDEPCAGLDPAAREHFLQFLERLAKRRTAPTLVLVTHHVEEIMPAFTHALLLRAGQVAAVGPLARVLTNRNLSEAFGIPMQISRRNGRYALQVKSKAKILM